MSHLAHQLLSWTTWGMLGYFIVLNAIYTTLLWIGWRAVDGYVKRRPLRDYATVGTSPLSMPVTILVPAYNEGPVIAESVRSLLSSQYLELEVMVINDGSKDDTLDVMIREFGMVNVDRVPRARLPTKEVRQVLASPQEPRLVVVDKVNGGKADALNVGLVHARYPLVCAIDGDTLLDPGALARLVWEFQAAPETVAVGGIVRIVNGSDVRDGRLMEVRSPRELLVNLQILEYLRAFLGGRIAWSRMGMLVIISGAFGLFRRDALVEVGGWDPTTVGEDAELVLRLHRRRREAGQPCRVTFFPDPICWTEAPSSLKVLIRQRDRWQRGLFEMLWRHKGMVGRSRYGGVGTVALPYFIVFELLGPTVEVLGYLSFGLALALGAFSPSIAALLALVSITYGLVLSFGTLLMEQRAFRRYPNWKDLRRLVLVAVLENFGWRQFMAFVRVRAWWTLWRGRKAGHVWGEMTRAGFGGTPAAPSAPVLVPVPAAAVPALIALPAPDPA